MKVRALPGAVQLQHSPLFSWPSVLALVLIGSTVSLWFVAISAIDVRSITDLGLVSVLPPTSWIALSVLTLSFCLTLRRLNAKIALLHVIVLIVMLYGVSDLIAEVPRFAPTWKHVGVAEYIIRTGEVDPKLNAYFNWPGFFAVVAFLTEVGGLDSPLQLVQQVLTFFNLLYLGPLLMIFRAFTHDQRLVWLSAWFFFITNWIGQDYFAPQALDYLLYLAILAILVTWFKGSDPASPRVWSGRWVPARLSKPLNTLYQWLTVDRAPRRPGSLRQRIGLVTLVIVLALASVPTHQLTPFVILGVVTLLVVANRCSVRSLPILVGVLIIAWMVYAASGFVAGHVEFLVGSMGDVTNIATKNLEERMGGSPEHVLIVRIRLVMTAALWGLALLGGIRRLWNGYCDIPGAIIAIAAFSLLLIHSYGGEMLLRVYFFVLPAMAFFAAALFYPKPTAGTSRRAAVALGGVSLVLLGCFMFARYGNERADQFTVEEFEAMEYLYSSASPNSVLVAGAVNLPWKYQDYDAYRYRSALPYTRENDVNSLVCMMSNKRFQGGYLILNRAGKVDLEKFYGEPSSVWDSFEQAIESSDYFRLVFANEDAKIYELTKRRRPALCLDANVR
jgi:hypothetical protein